jgi:Na+/proline symporter
MSRDASSQQIRYSVLTVLLVTLIGPLLVVILAGAGLVLAPPHTSLTLMFYGGLFFLSVPLILAALWRKRLKLRGCLATVVLTLFSFLVIATLAGPWLVKNIPGSYTQCVPSPTVPQGHYTCSSFWPNTGVTTEFALQGWQGAPIMRAVVNESE